MALKVDIVKKSEGVFMVSPAGSIDSQTYADFKDCLEPVLLSFPTVFILNMENVVYISSLGIGVILESRKAVEDRGNAFVMTNLQPQIKMTFEIIKNLPGMRVFENRAEADRYLAQIQRKEIEKQKGLPED
jgi:anti-anti-sigma factor